MGPIPDRLKALENETDRLACLYSYELLDTEVEKELDELSHLAASICAAPIGLIVLLDQNRQWFKSKYGWDQKETARSFSFCHYTLLEEGNIMEIENAMNDKRFAENPLVTGDPHIRFYCGSPLVNPEGYRLGSLCVIDQKPRKLNDIQKEALEVLSKQVVTHFELHKKKNLLERQKEILSIEVEKRTKALKETNDELKTFIYKSSHDLRGPIATILGLACLGRQKAKEEELKFYLEKISETGIRLDETLKNLLRIMQLKEDGQMQLEELGAKEIREMILNITNSYQSEVGLDLCIEPKLSFTTDKELLSIILKNLLDNSFKYFDERQTEKLIKIAIKETDGNKVKIILEDNGEGIEEEISGKVYDLFFRGNRKSKGSGLGLFIARKAIEKLNGSIHFSSIPKKETIFSVTLKKDLSLRLVE